MITMQPPGAIVHPDPIEQTYKKPARLECKGKWKMRRFPDGSIVLQCEAKGIEA